MLANLLLSHSITSRSRSLTVVEEGIGPAGAKPTDSIAFANLFFRKPWLAAGRELVTEKVKSIDILDTSYT